MKNETITCICLGIALVPVATILHRFNYPIWALSVALIAQITALIIGIIKVWKNSKNLKKLEKDHITETPNPKA